LTWIRAGDANTKLFHLRANARRCRNHIPSLLHEGRACVPHAAKANALEGFFGRQFGQTQQRQHTLNWDYIWPQQHDLSDLKRAISDEEIHAPVMHTAFEKGPRPNGYIGAFFKTYWDIVKLDIIAAIKEIFALWAGCWNLLNSANVVLIQKKEGAQSISDSKPISIMHNIAKLLAY
jgi:hypothetical protein